MEINRYFYFFSHRLPSFFHHLRAFDFQTPPFMPRASAVLPLLAAATMRRAPASGAYVHLSGNADAEPSFPQSSKCPIAAARRPDMSFIQQAEQRTPETDSAKEETPCAASLLPPKISTAPSTFPSACSFFPECRMVILTFL